MIGYPAHSVAGIVDGLEEDSSGVVVENVVEILTSYLRRYPSESVEGRTVVGELGIVTSRLHCVEEGSDACSSGIVVGPRSIHVAGDEYGAAVAC